MPLKKYRQPKEHQSLPDKDVVKGKLTVINNTCIEITDNIYVMVSYHPDNVAVISIYNAGSAVMPVLGVIKMDKKGDIRTVADMFANDDYWYDRLKKTVNTHATLPGRAIDIERIVS